MKEKSQTILKWFFILYVIPTSFYGMYLSFNEFYFFNIHDSTPIKFKNGFIFASTDEQNRRGNYNGIFYPNGEIAVKKNIVYVQEHGDFVYGYRDGKNPVNLPYNIEFYFVCGINEDCSFTQSYNWQDFQKTLKKKGLPPFEYRYFHHLKMLQVKEWLLVHFFLKDKVKPLSPPKTSTQEAESK
jgi:hypothetical protein